MASRIILLPPPGDLTKILLLFTVIAMMIVEEKPTKAVSACTYHANSKLSLDLQHRTLTVVITLRAKLWRSVL